MTSPVSTRRPKINRRDLLRAGAGGLAFGATMMPSLFTRASQAMTTRKAAGMEPANERIMVVVELSGGNDGLNTVVPYGDDAYYRARPTIGVPGEKVRRIGDDYIGLHPSLAGFERLYKDGKLAIVQGCGYENPVLSHFASMGFWHTGVPIAGEPLGWVGRVADAISPTPRENMIVNIDTQQSLAVRSAVHSPLVFDDPDRFRRDARFEQRRVLDELTGRRDADNPALGFLSRVADSAISSSAFVREAWANYQTPVNYGINIPMAEDLRKVVALIDAGLPTRLFYVAYRNNAFDTHVHQRDVHSRILSYATDAIHGFIEDLDRIGRGNDVTTMIFTEFGRRVPENTSFGTDHGTATPVYVVGNQVKGGIYGRHPSLTELDDGNLIHTTDFRRVYATMIDNWLGLFETDTILRGKFDRFDLIA